MERSGKVKRPGDAGTLRGARLKESISAAGSAAVGSESDCGKPVAVPGWKKGESRAPGIGLTSSSNEDEARGVAVSASVKWAAGRACIRVVRTVSRRKSWRKLGWRKRTSVLAGWTLTSTSCGGISRNSRTTGNEVGG